jgi:hypothetical protein
VRPKDEVDPEMPPREMRRRRRGGLVHHDI